MCINMDDEIFYGAAQSVKDAASDIRGVLEYMDEHASKLPHGLLEDVINNMQEASDILPDDLPGNTRWKKISRNIANNASKLNDNAHRFDEHMRRDRAKEIADRIDRLLLWMVG